MDMQAALRDRLVSSSAIVSLVWANPKSGTPAIYWIDRPQLAQMPAVTLQIVSDPRPQHLKGFQELRDTHVQVDVWSITYVTNKTITEAVLTALVPEVTSNGIRFNRAMVDSVRDLGESTATQFVHRTSIDLIVWWQEE